MSRLILIDGNSILNRAFYGIMGTKMLTTADGKYTNAVYGFFSILFKVMDDLQPEYMAVAFDVKAPTARHKMYEGYKATRKGMPNELAEQMPIVKDILELMNITIIEKEGYEADDVLGTLAKEGEKAGLDVTILSGDRDIFQLATEKISIRIPHTKAGKTEVDTFGEAEIFEKYGVKPIQLIEVKGLMGDTSDNIPGVPGVGEKTALELIKQYGSIDNMYKAIDEKTDTLKEKLKEKLIANKDLALLSRNLGTINIEVPLQEKVEDLKLTEWNNEKLFEKFKELNFHRFIDRFNLQIEIKDREVEDLVQIKQLEESEIVSVLDDVKKDKELVYFFEKGDAIDSTRIIKKKLLGISIYIKKKNTSYYIDLNDEKFTKYFKDCFENKEIKKFGYDMVEDYVMLLEGGTYANNIFYDMKIAAYDLNPTANNLSIENITSQYLNIDVDEYLAKYDDGKKNKNEQLNLFQEQREDSKFICGFKSYLIKTVADKTIEELKETGMLNLFKKIEMPLVEVLGNMQYNGMYVDKDELMEFGNNLKEQIEVLKREIYDMCGEEFNINSTRQLGVILFEKLGLTVYKKTKNGYSTDVDILEKLKSEHPVIEKILEYRSLMKLNSSYVEGLMPYINEKTKRIHSYFHQTITATGRISSTEPNLQTIPTRYELGKKLRKVFKPEEGNIFIDADYSQIELRVLADISGDRNMLKAFRNDEDIHKQVASKVFEIPMDDVTKEQRTAAKAVNFGIVYGISDFGLAGQLDITRKRAKSYIEQYLDKYSGIKKFMDEIVEEAKEQGYVETLFHRRRYIPELKSNNYLVRQFGSRAAMNTPIQGTAADIMKIAMINVFKRIQQEGIDAKIVLQVHDELILECGKEYAEEAKHILKEEMENAARLRIPLKVELSEASNWYDAK